MANFRKLAMLAAMLIRLIDEYLAGVRYRQASLRHRPTWRRSALPADPVRCTRHYGLHPLRTVPRCRPVGIGKHRLADWPGRQAAPHTQEKS
ncbi:hypothetical protein DFO67_103230 [Modicisalibacter xianhensis]|uniref:Uncharacterized protein n=1 Tax=Modicisalibacter xianhensis TaxID=442341 RepID=A0A4R8G884_9GAMM|nr:hypothetical protein [Halomonas xianhensis]TDX31632.1 hypothetical protein DFO67_103230 [Halomonas xianhensis]